MSNQVTTFITTDKKVAYNETRLSICLRADGFSFSVATMESELLTVGDVLFDEVSKNNPVKAVKEMLAEWNISTFGHKQMRLIVESNQFAWIPEHLYNSEQDRQYLALVSAPSFEGLGIYHIKVPIINSYLVFSAPYNIVTAFKVGMPGIDVYCQHALLVNEMLMNRSNQHPVMLMNIRDRVGDYVAFYNGQLLLSNSFSGENEEELLYHGIDLMKQLHLETPDMELTMCGNVNREIYALFQRFFPNVTLYNGIPFDYQNPAFHNLHTYKYPLILS